MKKILFICGSPVWGRPSPLSGMTILKKPATEYCRLANELFKEKGMDWQIELANVDPGEFEKLFEGEYDIFAFLPEGRTRLWMYQTELEKSGAYVYYLTMMEFHQKKVSKLVDYVRKLEEARENKSES